MKHLKSQNIAEESGVTYVSDTRFLFEHERFWKPCAYFAFSSEENAVMFSYPYGDDRHELDLGSLRALFQIEEGSPDDQALVAVEGACPRTHRIWPGSSVPSDLVDGTSVWTVEPDHVEATQNKIIAALDYALKKLDKRPIIPVADHVAGDKRFELAIELRLERLGFTPSKMATGQHQFQFFVDEFAYLEALRAHFSNIVWIVEKLNQARAAYAKDARTVNYVQQIQSLASPSLRDLKDKFHDTDAILGDILKVLTDFDIMLKEVRLLRTEIRTPIVYWDEIVRMWTLDDLPKKKSAKTLVRKSYERARESFEAPAPPKRASA